MAHFGSLLRGYILSKMANKREGAPAPPSPSLSRQLSYVRARAAPASKPARSGSGLNCKPGGS
jgi:hypothetical protein